MIMASKKLDIDGEAIARAIAADLPGWTRAVKRDDSDDADEAAASVNAEPGASLADLRRKFLGAAGAADSTEDSASAEPDDFGAPMRGRSTVKVRPKDGGPEKTVDIVGGKATIVQG
jgi:hypothetical protein